MDMATVKFIILFEFIAVSVVVFGQNAGDVMTSNMTLRDGDALVSAQGIFAFGFFGLEKNSTKRYVGVWYHSISVQTVIWVANRVVPVNNSSAVLSLSADGALVLFDKSTEVIWSTETSNATDPVLKLFDTGNLVLTVGSEKKVIWQSFDYPTDTILAEMKIGVDLREKLKRRLRSWTSPTDPSPSDYSYMFETRGVPESFIWKGSEKIGRYYGPWDADAYVHSNGVFIVSFVNTKYEVYYFVELIDKSRLGRAVLSVDGVLQGFFWSNSTNSWSFFGQFPEDTCDKYANCGPNSICNPFSTICQCLQGFVPKSSKSWELEQYSEGCISEQISDCPSKEFIKLLNMKLPDTLNATMSSNKTLDECRLWCLQNCTCTAYAVIGILGCLRWHGDLIDMRVPRAEGNDIYVRLPASVSDSNESSGKKKFQTILILLSVFGILLLCIGLILFLKRRKKNKDKTMTTSYFTDESDLELPMFDMLVLRCATNDFSEDNILGKGGFGPVYKGELEDGRLIAIKRLFKGSIQGLHEFKTEALLIAKLQHRNLVRLIGCCIQDDERILIYEYMQNTSLDAFIFDRKNKLLLNWQKRLDIIRGIARGLLYLHQDSRLKIIHRDLKPNNVLLDEQMNPKISDFGMARIFGADQIHQYTKKVVGTYGYMAPEYAMDGIFSEKSDVYSFGVIILEILSGKKVSNQAEKQTFLLAQAWNLWKEDKCLNFLDNLDEPYDLLSKLIRCIQIGLLCVQEKSKDRPSMEEVVLMLDDESVMLHDPMIPAFCMSTSSTSNEVSDCTLYNDVTMTMIEGR